MGEKCLFGSGKQDASTCPMIYVHWPGYYPGDELYYKALIALCPNITSEIKKHLEKKIGKHKRR